MIVNKTKKKYQLWVPHGGYYTPIEYDSLQELIWELRNRSFEDFYITQSLDK